MKGIIKRLCTGVLAFATLLSALPGTAVLAAEKQYWTEGREKVGRIEKVMNDGTIEQTFNESWFVVEGAETETAYCIDINTDFEPGYKTRTDASTRMSEDQIADVALSLEYVKKYGESHGGLTDKQLYLMEQCVVWQRLSVHLGWGCDNVRGSYDEIPKAVQDEVYQGAKAFVQANKGRYECGGYIYTGQGQDLGQFWAELAAGGAKVKKASASPDMTERNGLYTIAGAVYGVYADKGCTKQVATLTTGEDGSTETVEVPAGTIYIRELSAPAGYKVDSTTYPLEVEPGATAVLEVSDTPKAAEPSLELFKMDAENQADTPQGSGSLAGAEFTWKFYAGYHSLEDLPAEPTRTWVTKTLAEQAGDGTLRYVTRLSDAYKVSGDSFYTLNGKTVLPLGTLTVEETKSPEGYLLDGAYMQTVDGAEQVQGVYLTQITEDGELAALTGYNAFSVFDSIVRGGVKIQKRDFDTAGTTPQGSGSLAGAAFAVVSLNENPVLVEGTLYQNGETVKTLYTGGDGSAQTAADLLPYGRYRIEETAAPDGYLTEGAKPVEFSVTEQGKIVDLTGEEASVFNQVKRGGVKIQKRDLETEDTTPQGGATLNKAAFTITTLNENPVWVEGVLYEKGEAVKTIYTGEDGIAATSADTLTVGTYEIAESKAPVGYLTDGAEAQTFTITEDGEVIELTDNAHSVYNQVIRGGVKIQKRDLETGDTDPQGGATLKRAKFTITNLNPNPVLVDGILYEKEEVVKTIYTDEDGVAKNAADLLPYGTYRIEEQGAPEGYLTDGAKPVEFSIIENGVLVDLTGAETSIYNQVKRGDLEGVKIGAGTHKRLADVPFQITSKSTGESHVIVTDANGQFSTSFAWVSHKQDTNKGEDSEDGIWFGTSEPDDEKGALLYDTYEIEELRCESNEGFELIPPFEVVISRDKLTVDLGTLTDEYEPVIAIHTTAASAEGEKSIAAGKELTIVDTVSLTNLEVGTDYELVGWQMLKDENAELILDGQRVENTYAFTAEKEEMEIKMEFTFDGSGLAGRNLVTFEELYDMTDPEVPKLVAEHKEIEDEGQTVLITERIINLHTTAADPDGNKELEAGGEITIVDTVKMDGLEVGTDYQLAGWQMIKEDNAELIIGGERVENTYAFTADKEEMEVEVTFTFDSAALAGKNLVTFEELYDMTDPEEPKKVAEHKDLESEEQTVTFKEKPEEPEEPEEPETPDEPATPEEPETPTNPSQPETPDTPDTPSQSTPTADAPKTGDTTNLILPLVLLILSGLGLAGGLFYQRRKKKKS